MGTMKNRKGQVKEEKVDYRLVAKKLRKEDDKNRKCPNRIIGFQVAKNIKSISLVKDDYIQRRVFTRKEGDYLALMVETPIPRDKFMSLWKEGCRMMFRILGIEHIQDCRLSCLMMDQEDTYIIYGRINWSQIASLEERWVEPCLLLGRKNTIFRSNHTIHVLPKRVTRDIQPLEMYLTTYDVDDCKEENYELYTRRGLSVEEKNMGVHLWFTCKNTFPKIVVRERELETKFRVYDADGNQKCFLHAFNFDSSDGSRIIFLADIPTEDWSFGYYTAKAFLWGTLVAECQFYVGRAEVGRTAMKNHVQTTDKGETIVTKAFEPADNAIGLIQQMVGLTEVKTLLEQNINYIKLMEARKRMGLPSGNRLMHVVMSGAPGTGKTTVARLLGAAYKEMGILSKGHTVECNRASLVSDHIGGTEKTTQEKIAEAKGGVLFIDEAYSLLAESPTSNDFGGRIIDTLMTVLSDPEADILVVLAGYEDEMKKLMGANTGLASRFPVRLNFPNYSVDELLTMVDSYFKKQSYDACTQVMQRIRNVIERVITVKSFGEGRFVKTFIENMVLPNMASRLFAKPQDKGVNKVDLTRILPQDVPEPEEVTAQMKEPEKKIRAIGFR